MTQKMYARILLLKLLALYKAFELCENVNVAEKNQTTFSLKLAFRWAKTVVVKFTFISAELSANVFVQPKHLIVLVDIFWCKWNSKYNSKYVLILPL